MTVNIAHIVTDHRSFTVHVWRRLRGVIAA